MSELIPVWIDGRITPVDKIEAHRKGLRHKAVSVFVMDGSRLLIQKRAAGKYHTPGLWANTCCTHPRLNEKPVDCAVRRLEEELGITELFPAFRDQVEYRADVGNGLIEHEVVDIFVAEADASLPMSLNAEEVEEVRWVDVYDLRAQVERRPHMFTPWLKIYLEDHSATIFGNITQE